MYESERALLVAAGRRLAEGGLVVGTSGNLSLRAGEHVVVTASGTDLGALTPDLLTVVDLTGTVVAGHPRPTTELPLHLAIHTRTAAKAVAPAHAMSSIAVGCTHDELPPVHYATLQLGGVVRVARYATFGSAALAANVLAALTDRAAALMRNHGSIALGETLDEACARLELVEWLAETYRRAVALGTPRRLTDEELTAAANQFTELDYGAPPPD